MTLQKPKIAEKIDNTSKEIVDSRTDFFRNNHNNLSFRLREDFTNIHNKLNNASLIEQTGQDITVKHSYAGYARDMKIEGATYQNPDNLAEISSCGEAETVNVNGETKYKISILSKNKNLLSGWKKGRVVETTGEQMETAYSNNLISIEKIKIKGITDTLTLSTNITNTNYIKIAFYKKDDTFIKCDFTPSTTNTFTSKIVPAETYYCRLSINCNGGLPSNLTEEMINASQLEVGKISTPYEPQKTYKKDILLSEPLRGLEGGIKDSIEVINGKVSHVKRLQMGTSTGTEPLSELLTPLPEPIIIPLDVDSIELQTFDTTTYATSKNAIKPTLTFKAPVNVPAVINDLKNENTKLKEEIEVVNNKNLELNNELIEVKDFALDIDFRACLTEIDVVDIKTHVGLK